MEACFNSTPHRHTPPLRAVPPALYVWEFEQMKRLRTGGAPRLGGFGWQVPHRTHSLHNKPHTPDNPRRFTGKCHLAGADPHFRSAALCGLNRSDDHPRLRLATLDQITLHRVPRMFVGRRSRYSFLVLEAPALKPRRAKNEEVRWPCSSQGRGIVTDFPI